MNDRPWPLRTRIADTFYALRGTRGLTLAAGALLILAAVEPALPPAFPNLAYTLLLLVVLLVGLMTLPREGVAVQARARHVIDDPQSTRRMARRSLWGAAVCVALLPNLFLAVQGIPHMSPLAGLVLPAFLRWIGLLGMLTVLLLCVLYLRSSRSYAPGIVTPRARELDDAGLARRDVLAISLLVIAVAWAWMLQGFWRPFSLLQWHGGDLGAYFSSLAAGSRGIAGIVFSVVPPALLFIVLSAHLDLLRLVHVRRAWGERKAVVALALVHVLLCVMGVALHMYNLLWIVRYRSLGFL